MQALTRMLQRRLVWYGLAPAATVLAYWFGLRSFAFTDSTAWRIPALPKVFFDQTMYLAVMAKDIIHGFRILPLPLRPFVWLAGKSWPVVSLSELYAIGIILSAIASLWLLAALIRRVGGLEVGETRTKALAAFLMVQAILVLRPAGPSWYVPFFLFALLLVWLGEGELERGSRLRAITLWLVAVVASSVYPWYFAVIVTTSGLLFLMRFIRASFVLPLIGAGLVLASATFVLRDWIIATVTSSNSVLIAVYGGVGWSHLTTLSNTILIILAWCVAWTIVVRRVWMGADSVAKRTSLILAIAWVSLSILWFQSLLTGLSILPDHFIYPVWLLSAVSWAVWPSLARDGLSARERRTVSVFGAVAMLYVLYIFAKLIAGSYVWSAFPSLIIHMGIWTFLALAMMQTIGKEKSRDLQVGATQRVARTSFSVALAIGSIYTLIGAWGVRAAALDRLDVDREMDGVRRWIAGEHPSADLRWCSDVLAGDYLFPTTGQDFYPSMADKHDPVSIETLQNRLLEVATYFNVRQAGDLYLWDDMILLDLEFPCRAFVPAIRIADALPLASSTRLFVTGCNQEWADGERARVVSAMDARWSAPLPARSALCDRFVVRKRLETSWRVPAAYSKLYEDATAEVYGKEVGTR